MLLFTNFPIYFLYHEVASSLWKSCRRLFLYQDDRFLYAKWATRVKCSISPYIFRYYSLQALQGIRDRLIPHWVVFRCEIRDDLSIRNIKWAINVCSVYLMTNWSVLLFIKTTRVIRLFFISRGGKVWLACNCLEFHANTPSLWRLPNP